MGPGDYCRRSNICRGLGNKSLRSFPFSLSYFPCTIVLVHLSAWRDILQLSHSDQASVPIRDPQDLCNEHPVIGEQVCMCVCVCVCVCVYVRLCEVLRVSPFVSVGVQCEIFCRSDGSNSRPWPSTTTATTCHTLAATTANNTDTNTPLGQPIMAEG